MFDHLTNKSLSDALAKDNAEGFAKRTEYLKSILGERDGLLAAGEALERDKVAVSG